MKNKRENVVARLTIDKPGKMKREDFVRVTGWLRRMAGDLSIAHRAEQITDGRFVAKLYPWKTPTR